MNAIAPVAQEKPLKNSIKIDSMTMYESIKRIVAERGTTCPAAYVFPKDGEPTLLVCELATPDDEELLYEKLRGVCKLMEVEAVAMIMVYNVVLPTQDDMLGSLFSVSIYTPGEETWTYGWTYMKMEGKIEWVEEFCSDTKRISAKVLDLWGADGN